MPSAIRLMLKTITTFKFAIYAWLAFALMLAVLSIANTPWVSSRLGNASSDAGKLETFHVAQYNYGLGPRTSTTAGAIDYEYGRTEPINFGDVATVDDAYIHIQLQLNASDTNGYPNVFQTAPGNSGIRMEIAGGGATVLVPDPSLVGGLKGLTVIPSVETSRWYKVEVEALNGAFVRVSLDGKLVGEYTSPTIHMETSKILIGQGLDGSRPFRGSIRKILVTKGEFLTPIPFGGLKTSQDAYIHLNFHFRVDDVEGHPNLFQTAPGNRGLRLEISGESATLLIHDPSVPAGIKGLPVTTSLKAGRWYSLDVEALNGAYVHAALDSVPIPEYVNNSIDLDTSQILVGGGFDSTRGFRGQIQDITVIEGNQPKTRHQLSSPWLYLFLIFVPFPMVVYWIWREMPRISRFFEKPNAPALSLSAAALVVGGFAYYVFFAARYGYLPSPFVYVKFDTFMDLFNTMHWAYDDGRYTQWMSVYPPLSFCLLRLLNFLTLGSTDQSPLVMREGSMFLICVVCLLYLSIPALILNTTYSGMTYWRERSAREKVTFYIAIVLSAPMLFALERGNLVLLCPLILALATARIGMARALAIAFLINLKPYFVVLLAFYVVRRAWSELSATVLFAVTIFLLSGMLLDSNFLLFFQNLFNFSRASNLFSSMEVMALPTSISSFSYVLNHADGGILNPGFIFPSLLASVAFTIEAVKWIAIASCMYLLFRASSEPSIRDGELLALLIAIITNLGISVGGYSVIFYIAFLPIFISMKDRWFFLTLLAALALPWDAVPLTNHVLGRQYSYVSNSIVDVRWTLGLGSFLRPIFNFALLIGIARELLSRILARSTSDSVMRAAWAQLQAKFPRVIARANLYFGIGVVVVSITIYNSLFYNRYFPITEGWFSAYAHLIRHGQVPYLDFYLLLPPAYPLELAAFQSLFGEGFLALRILGIAIVVCLALVLFLLLNRRFSPAVSAIAAVTATIYYQAGVAHIDYDFIQIFTLFVLIAIYLISRYLDDRVSVEGKLRRRAPVKLFVAGVLVALAFLTKQSNGALVVVFSAIAVWFASGGQTFRAQIKDLIVYLVGMAAPVILVLVALSLVGAALPFAHQVFFGAIAAKGSIWHILSFWIEGVVNRAYLIQLTQSLFLIAPLLLLSATRTYFLKGVGRPNEGLGFDMPILGAFAGLVVVVLGLAFANVEFLQRLMNVRRLDSLFTYTVAPTTALVAFLVVFFAFAWTLPSLQRFVNSNRDLAVGVFFSLGLIFGNGTSSGISEVSLFLASAVILCLLMSLPNCWQIARVGIVAACVVLILCLSNAKFRQPYSWWLLSEPDVLLSTTTPSTPLLAGFELSPSSASLLDEASHVIQMNSNPDDDVFAFPSIPALYLFSNRWPHSKVVVSWFDFLPDQLAEDEAARILKAPPAVIANLRMPEIVWTEHERAFREGHPLGQRAIRAAIDVLTLEKGLYELDLSREIPTGCILEIWHRKVAQAAN